MSTNHHHRPGLLPGLILASVGGGLLAREFGLLPAHLRLLDFWPLLLVFFGISSVFRARGVMGALFSLTFLALGGVLLARNLGFLAFSAARLWPGLLVLLGIAFLIRAARGSGPHEPSSEPPTGASPAPGDDFDDFEQPRGLSTDADRLDKQILFSGLDFKIDSQAWTGGRLDVTAGGVELDLRYARLAPEGALLHVHVVMGGVDIRVPDTWQVRCDVTPLLGGADDTTRSTQGSGNAPVLRVVGSVTLGGLSIRN